MLEEQLIAVRDQNAESQRQLMLENNTLQLQLRHMSEQYQELQEKFASKANENNALRPAAVSSVGAGGNVAAAPPASEVGIAAEGEERRGRKKVGEVVKLEAKIRRLEKQLDAFHKQSLQDAHVNQQALYEKDLQIEQLRL